MSRWSDRRKPRSSRLNLVQAFNSLGTTLAPLFGGYLILGRSTSGTWPAGASADACRSGWPTRSSVQLPYLIVAVVLVVLAVVIARFPLPSMGGATAAAPPRSASGHSLWRHRNLVFGVPAIFIYLIAEIGVANLFINFVSQPQIGNLTPRTGLALSVPAVGRDDGRPLRRQLRDARDPRRARARGSPASAPSW